MPTPEPTEQQRQAAILAGWRALDAGLPEDVCPYSREDRRRDAWLASYRAARALVSPAALGPPRETFIKPIEGAPASL